MPKTITPEREIAYLRALAGTGNATLAAEKAGVSKSWTYKKRREDAAFDALYRRMVAAARVRLKEEARWRAAPPLAPALSTPPLPAQPAAESPSPAEGGGNFRKLVVQMGKRVQVRRARAREWTAETDRRFLGALASAKDLGIALSSAGVSATAAYRRRETWPAFARGWSEALACDDWEVLAWVPECIAAMLDAVEQSRENPGQDHQRRRGDPAVRAGPGQETRAADAVRGKAVTRALFDISSGLPRNPAPMLGRSS